MNANPSSLPLHTLTLSVPQPLPLEDGEFIVKFRSRGGKFTTGLLRRVEARVPRERTAAELTKEERLAAFEQWAAAASKLQITETPEQLRDSYVEHLAHKHLGPA